MGRKRIAGILRQAFDVQSNRTWHAIVLFCCGAIAFGVLVNALAPVFTALSQCALSGGLDAQRGPSWRFLGCLRAVHRPLRRGATGFRRDAPQLSRK